MRQKQGIGELRQFLPRGYAVELSKQFGCSRSKIYKVVTGERQDYVLLRAITEMAETNLALENKIQRTNQKLQKNGRHQ